MKKVIKESENKFTINDSGIIERIRDGWVMKSKCAQFPLSNGVKKCMTRRSLFNIYFPDLCPPIRTNKDKELSKLKRSIYGRFSKMVSRCYNTEDPQYINYGARGIKIYDKWLANRKLFIIFCLENGMKKELTIDRINNNDGYYPDNIRFVDRVTQNNNQRNNIIIYCEDGKYTLSELCRKYNRNYKKMYSWYRKLKDNDQFLECFFNDYCTPAHYNIVIFNGVEYTLRQLSEKYNFPYRIIKSRYTRGKRGIELLKPVINRKLNG